MCNPRLILLDEVSLGLSPIAVAAVYESLQALIGGRHDGRARRAGSRARAQRRVADHLHAPRRGRARGRVDRADARADHRGVLRRAAASSCRSRVMTWVNAILQGVLLGGFYALLACGLSLMFGVMRIINLAHGDIAVIGAYLIWLIATQPRSPPFARSAAGDSRACGSSGTRCTCCCWSAAGARGSWCRCSPRSAWRSSSRTSCSRCSRPMSTRC